MSLVSYFSYIHPPHHAHPCTSSFPFAGLGGMRESRVLRGFNWDDINAVATGFLICLGNCRKNSTLYNKRATSLLNSMSSRP